MDVARKPAQSRQGRPSPSAAKPANGPRPSEVGLSSRFAFVLAGVAARRRADQRY